MLWSGPARAADVTLGSEPRPVSIPIDYTLPREAQVSLNIYDAGGQIVRELLHADKRQSGANHETWDGLDENGQPAPAGTYTWKLLATQGLKAEYLLTLGTNPTPRWDTWPGNHVGTNSAAADATGIYVGGPGEGSITLLKQSLADSPADEKRLWTLDHWLEGWQGPAALSVAAGRLFMLQGNGKTQVLEAGSGKYLSTWPCPYTDKEVKSVTHWIGVPTALDMAGRGDFLVSCEKLHNLVRWLDPQSGKSLDQATVPEPSAIAVDSRGKIFVLSLGAVYVLTRDQKTPVLLVPANQLQGAWRLDVDPTTGDVLVLESGFMGDSTQQVKRFSPSGSLITAYGTRGGRPPQGVYEPSGFYNGFDIAATPDGGFLVAEPWWPPRRLVRYDAKGNIVREWYGGQMYANFACADPEDPTLVWLDSNWGSLIEAKVDYVNRTWKVLATYSYTGLADGLIHGPAHGGGRWRVLHHDGQTLLALEGPPTLVRVDEKNRRLVPLVVAVNNIMVPWNANPWSVPAVIQNWLGNDKATPMHSLLWTDKNGDGMPQREEVAFTKWSTWGSGWCMDKDANYYYCSDIWEQNKFKEKVVLKVGVKAWSKDGVPDYTGWEDAPIVAHVPPQFKAFASSMTAVSPDGSLVGAFNIEAGGAGGKAFGQGGWAGRVGGNKVVRWSPGGQPLWNAGHHAPASLPKQGEAGFFFRLLGTAHDCIAVTDVESSRVHVWDKDGLWVGRFLDNPDLSVAPKEAYALCGENFGGSLYENPKTGNVIFYGGGINNSPVFRIRGWDEFERQHGTLELTQEAASKIRASAQFEASREDIMRMPARVDSFVADGDLKEWQALKPVEIKDGDTTVAKVWAGFSSSMLVAAWDVTTKTPWKNASTDQLAFQGGASVSLDIGLWDPVRKGLAPGDMRLVVAPTGGKEKVMLYMPIVPLDAQHRRQDNGPIYQTANGKIQMERFEAGWTAVAKPKADGSGYTVEMQAPMWWLLLPFYPGQKLRFDASVALANEAGNKTETRLNWHSKDPADMFTNDLFYEASLRPQNWGEAIVK